MAKHQSFLPHSGKVDLKKLSDIPTSDFTIGENFASETTLYQMHSDGICLDFLWSPKEGYKNIFILFSGDVPREKYQLPVFQRWSWAPHFPGNTLYVADPMLRQSDSLGLAWYVGDKFRDPMKVIAKLIKSLCRQYKVEERNLTFYGSSGGGFAALRSLLFFERANAVAINPQTNIAKYHKKKVSEFLGSLYSGLNPKEMFNSFGDKADLLLHVETLADKNIVYVQNKLDSFHADNHERPFFEEIERNGLKSNIKRIRFDHEGGHGKAETPDVFGQSLEYISSVVDTYRRERLENYNGGDAGRLKDIVLFFKTEDYTRWAIDLAKFKAFKVKGECFELMNGYYDVSRNLNFLTFSVNESIYTIVQRLGPCEVLISHKYRAVVEVDRFPDSVAAGIDCFLLEKKGLLSQKNNQFQGFLFGGHVRPYHQVYDCSLTFNELCLKSNRKKIINSDISFFPARLFPGDVETWNVMRLSRKDKGFFLLSCRDGLAKEKQLRAFFKRVQDFAGLEKERLQVNPGYINPQGKLVIWLGTNFMKRSFVEQEEFFDFFIQRVLQLSSNVLFVVDGVTATLGQNKKQLQDNNLVQEKRFVERLITKHNLKGKLVSLIGERAIDKLAYASFADFFVTNALTDSMWCSAFFRKPGVLHYSPLALSEALITQRHYKAYFIPKNMISSERKKGKPSPWADYSINPSELSTLCFDGLNSALCLQHFAISTQNGDVVEEGASILLAPNEPLLFSNLGIKDSSDLPSIACENGKYEVKFDVEVAEGTGVFRIENTIGDVVASSEHSTFIFQLADELGSLRFSFIAGMSAVSIKFYGVRAQKLLGE